MKVFVLTHFKDLGLAAPLTRAVTREGYTTPTLIQQQVIPAMLADRDILGIAQTGTGKTAAFVLPILHRLAAQKIRIQPKSATALIVTPTRELASQIANNIRIYGKELRPSIAVVVGGVKPGPQMRQMAGGVDILVATPGRLLDHLDSGAVRLDNTDIVVLDEADQMMDLGFLKPVRRIMSAVSADRQTVLMSATMPKQIRALASDFLSDPAEISVAPAGRPIERINQSVMHVRTADKRRVLTALLTREKFDRTIVFTRTKHGADKVTKVLGQAGLNAAAIHGNKSQGQRQRALAEFSRGRIAILVATDVAARGIDIDDVSHVVNFDLPDVPESYVHRIGRTARAGKDGQAIALCGEDDRGLLRAIEKKTGCILNVIATIGAGDANSDGAPPVTEALEEIRPAAPKKSGTRSGKPRRRSGSGPRRGAGTGTGTGTDKAKGTGKRNGDLRSARSKAGTGSGQKSRTNNKNSRRRRGSKPAGKAGGRPGSAPRSATA